jgi:hypothetical protein
MSDYESGSPPSRGEMESSTSLGTYSCIPNMNKRICSPLGSISMPNCINDTTSSLSTKRYSVGSNSLDYDYQISDAADRRRFVRRSLDQAFDFPDLRPSINTKFTSNQFASNYLRQQNYEYGFDFGDQYKQLFDEHKKSAVSNSEICSAQNNEGLSNSLPRLGFTNDLTDSANSLSTDKTLQMKYEVSSIWCMDYQENLIVIGCANGSLEFWEGTTGKFKVHDSYIF